MRRLARRLFTLSSVLLLIVLAVRCDRESDSQRVVRHACERNLARIHVALQSFARSNEEHLPDSVDSLIVSGLLATPVSVNDENPLLCIGSADGDWRPRDRDEWVAEVRGNRHVSYRLLRPGEKLGTGDRVAVVAEAEAGTHSKGGHVLYSDGTVAFVNATELRDLLRGTK